MLFILNMRSKLNIVLINNYLSMKSHDLEKYAFMWNQARLVVAALSLIFGGFPLIYRLFSTSTPLVGPILTLFWIVSGVSAAYLLYLFVQGGKRLWGGKNRTDLIAFAIAVGSGLHLGITGLTGMNIGMRVLPYGVLPLIMLVAGAAYLWAAFYLYKKQKANPIMFG